MREQSVWISGGYNNRETNWKNKPRVQMEAFASHPGAGTGIASVIPTSYFQKSGY